MVPAAIHPFLLGWFNATHQLNLFVPSFNRLRFRRWNYFPLEHVLYGKLASRPTCFLGTNDLLAAADSLALIPTELEAHTHSKINRYYDSEAASRLTPNHADLTFTPPASAPLVDNLDSPQRCGSHRTSDPAIDSHPHCLICGTPSTHSCLDCDQCFCGTHLYTCDDCNTQCCGDCLDAHQAEGHWSDSGTAAELAHTHHASRASYSPPLDLSVVNLAACIYSGRRSSWLTVLLALRSLLALLFSAPHSFPVRSVLVNKPRNPHLVTTVKCADSSFEILARPWAPA